MEATRIWVHFGGQIGQYANYQYQAGLRNSAPSPKVPPGYTLLDWQPSPYQASTDLIVINHGGSIDPAKIARFIQASVCPNIPVTADRFGTVEVPDSNPG